MKPNSYEMSLIRSMDERERREYAAHRKVLHDAAILRRRKAKRGGKR